MVSRTHSQRNPAARFAEPHRLLFFSIHLFDSAADSYNKASGYEFFPGTGKNDDTAHNVINVPLLPIWRERHALNGHGSGGAAEPHATRSSGLLVKPPQPPPAFGGGGAGGRAPPLSGRGAFRHAITTRLVPSLRAFNPDLVRARPALCFDAGSVTRIRGEGVEFVRRHIVSPDDAFDALRRR